MARFKIRDLMINLSQAERRAAGTCCRHNTFGWTIILDPPCGGGTVACAVCTLRLTDGCPPVSDCGLTPCHPAITNTGPLDFFQAEDLKLLQDELRRELGHVDARLAEREKELEPQTLDEVSNLEKKLGDAL